MYDDQALAVTAGLGGAKGEHLSILAGQVRRYA